MQFLLNVRVCYKVFEDWFSGVTPERELRQTQRFKRPEENQEFSSFDDVLKVLPGGPISPHNIQHTVWKINWFRLWLDCLLQEAYSHSPRATPILSLIWTIKTRLLLNIYLFIKPNKLCQRALNWIFLQWMGYYVKMHLMSAVRTYRPQTLSSIQCYATQSLLLLFLKLLLRVQYDTDECYVLCSSKT